MMEPTEGTTIKEGLAGSEAVGQLAFLVEDALAWGAAWLAGGYEWAFCNETARPVKLLILEEPASEGTYITLPPTCEVTTFASRTTAIRVTGGFGLGDSTGGFEIFWDSRRLEWRPGALVPVQVSEIRTTNVVRRDLRATLGEAVKEASSPLSGRSFSSASTFSGSGGSSFGSSLGCTRSHAPRDLQKPPKCLSPDAETLRTWRLGAPVQALQCEQPIPFEREQTSVFRDTAERASGPRPLYEIGQYVEFRSRIHSHNWIEGKVTERAQDGGLRLEFGAGRKRIHIAAHEIGTWVRPLRCPCSHAPADEPLEEWDFE